MLHIQINGLVTYNHWYPTTTKEFDKRLNRLIEETIPRIACTTDFLLADVEDIDVDVPMSYNTPKRVVVIISATQEIGSLRSSHEEFCTKVCDAVKEEFRPYLRKREVKGLLRVFGTTLDTPK